MHIRFTAATCDTTGNALMIVAVQDDGANLLPTKLLHLRSVGDGYHSSADRTRDSKTNTVSIYHQTLAAVGTVEGDVNHGCQIANGENGQSVYHGQAARIRFSPPSTPSTGPNS